jgi:hypothetical protein
MNKILIYIEAIEPSVVGLYAQGWPISITVVGLVSFSKYLSKTLML